MTSLLDEPEHPSRSTVEKAQDATELLSKIKLAVGSHPGGTLDALLVATLAVGHLIRHHSPTDDKDAFEPMAAQMERMFSNALREETPSFSTH